MKRLALSLFISAVFSFSVFSQQSNSAELKTVEFISPIKADGKFDRSPVRKNCFSFITETAACGKVSDIYYGGLRAGSDWDWLQAMGAGSRNKIKKIGRKNWTDDFNVPVVEPYAKLQKGEQRLIVLGGNENGRLPNLPGGEAQTSEIFPGDLAEAGRLSRDTRKEQPKSDYKPFVKAVSGNMYVMRVVDEKEDFYVLFRIDELEKGTRCKISWKRIEAPQEN
jgi:hypothetical protein